MNTSNMLMPDYMGDFLNSGDPLLMEYFLVRNSMFPLGIIFSYLMFSKYLGPRFMAKRKPKHINKIVATYDLCCILANAAVAYEIMMILYIYGWSSLCMEAVSEEQEALRREAVRAAYNIYALKLIEMVDTVFFVLRKKMDHISNLHVFHHSSVPLLVWMTLRTQKRMHLTMYGIINCIVHIFMYTYYGLIAVGLEFKGVLQWKRYITLLQIIQFLLMIPYLGFLLISDCASTKTIVCIYMVHTVFLLILFAHYYRKNYLEKGKSVKNSVMGFNKEIKNE